MPLFFMVDLHIPTEFDLSHADALYASACEVRLRAYAPYSNYLVGTALLTADNKIYVGCNVEAADYDGTHAEESALSAMIADGNRAPLLLATIGGLGKNAEPYYAPPCGKCRQKLMEFSSLANCDLRILVRDPNGELRIVLLSELLPWSFGPKDVGVISDKNSD